MSKLQSLKRRLDNVHLLLLVDLPHPGGRQGTFLPTLEPNFPIYTHIVQNPINSISHMHPRPLVPWFFLQVPYLPIPLESGVHPQHVFQLLEWERSQFLQSHERYNIIQPTFFTFLDEIVVNLPGDYDDPFGGTLVLSMITENRLEGRSGFDVR